MAESQEGASSHLNSKEKSSLLDLDFGKDFLSSWKSMSVAEDDAMDFDFGTVAKGKKKAFSFGKLDVDFSFDGDLDKISSFKVDMSDLDISLPKKSGKSKERSKGESAGGNHQEKQDCFSLPFDFSELDGFSFESSLKKEVQKIDKNKDNEESSNRNAYQTSRMDFTDGIAASEYDGSPKLATPQGVTTSKTETMVDALGDDSINNNFPTNSPPNDNGPSNSAIVQVLVPSEEAIILSEKTITTSAQEIDPENHHQEEKTSPESCAQETMQDLSIQSASRNDSTRETASELQVEVCSAATKVISNVGREQNVNFKSVAEMGLNCDSLLMNSLSQDVAKSLSKYGETSRFGSDNNVLIDNINGTEPAQGDSDSEGISTTSVSGESMHNTRVNAHNKNVNSKLCLTPLSSGTSVAKSIQRKEKEAGVIRPKYFKSSDEKESQSKMAPLTQTKISMFGSKTIGSRQLIDEGRDGTEAKNAQRGSKLVRVSTSLSAELNKGEPVRAGSMRSVKDLHSIGKCSDADGVLHGSKLIGSSSVYDREVIKSGPVQGNERNVKNLMTLNSSEQTNTSAKQNRTTSRLPALSTVSIKNSNDICGEGNKTSLKTDRSLLDLSILKISRTTGVNHHASNSTFPKQIKSVGNTKQNMELQGIAGSVATPSVGTEKQISPTPSLKRKSFEASSADMPNLNPSKRLSQSPSGSRNIKELSERVVDKKVCNNVDLAASRTSSVLKDFQTSAVEIPQDMNTTELEMPLVMEKDDNVEKAEAYTKELEDICNMLKKKHEEAKELLVRAIVNNNNLLMLNHPIYEEKIRKVQKFAAQLMSKELHAHP